MEGGRKGGGEEVKGVKESKVRYWRLALFHLENTRCDCCTLRPTPSQSLFHLDTQHVLRALTIEICLVECQTKPLLKARSDLRPSLAHLQYMPSIQSCHLYGLAIYSYSDFGLCSPSCAVYILLLHLLMPKH